MALRTPLARGAVGLLLTAALAAASCQRVDRAAPVSQPPPVITTKSGAEMVLIPAGSFLMGRENGPPDQAPVHEVSLDSFLIDRYEVTQEEYGKVVLENGSHFKGPKRPTEMVSWADAALYCNLRSRAEGLDPCYDEQTTKCNFEANGYRLPTEAEREYACRAGSQDDYSFGSDPRLLGEHAWYAENAAKKTQPAGEKKPNAWWLFDMHGNVAEWCNDVYEKDYYQHSAASNPRGPEDGEMYVLRGGAWNSSAEACLSASRVGQDPGFQDACFARNAIGFRCVRKAPAN